MGAGFTQSVMEILGEGSGRAHDFGVDMGAETWGGMQRA